MRFFKNKFTKTSFVDTKIVSNKEFLRGNKLIILTEGNFLIFTWLKLRLLSKLRSIFFVYKFLIVGMF